MPDDAHTTPGRQFAQDMHAIREQAGVTIEAIHEETKIPIGLIESFEDSALFDNPQFNIVYLRSFVRSYADMVGIDPDEALAALERARQGRYNRDLAVAHLGYKPPRENVDTPAPESRTGPDGPGRKPPVQPSPPAGARQAPPPPPAETPAPEATPPAPSLAPAPKVPSARRASRQASQPPADWWKDRRMLGILAMVVLLVAVVAVALTLWLGGTQAPEPEPEPPPPVDTLAAMQAELEPVEPPAPRVVLGDTFDVTVVAAFDKVEGIRVRVDDDMRRPYWLELDSIRTFPVTRQIILENQLNDIRLRVEDVEYPPARFNTQATLELTRADLQAYLDSLQNQ